MSLMAAYAFGNMTVFEGEVHKEPPGFTQFSDSGATLRPGFHAGAIQRKVNPDTNNQAVYFRLPVINAAGGFKDPQVGDRFILGYRLKNLVADNMMRPFRIIQPDAGGNFYLVDPGISMITLGFPVGVRIEEAYLEIDFNMITGRTDIYNNGRLIYTWQISTALLAHIAKFKFLGFDIPLREYVAISRDPALAPSVRDIYMLQTDGIYPTDRLGPVKISDVPVTVTDVTGFDKSVAELESVVNQGLWANSTTPFTANCEVAKLTAGSGEVGFKVQADSSQSGKYVAVGLRVGAKRTGAVPLTAIVETDRGDQVIDRPSVNLPAMGSERMHFSTPVAVKDDPVLAGANVADMAFKLKVTGA